MTVSAVFGKIVTGRQVEQAVTAFLQAWLPTYTAEVARQTGRDDTLIAPVRSWSTSNRFARRPEDQLPAGIVISPGISDRPERRGDGSLGAWWRIGVAIVAAGKAGDQDDANELAKLYGAAVRAALAQHPSLGGFADGLELVAETYDDVPADYLPVGAVVEVDADVHVAEIVNTDGGPMQPITPDPTVPPGDWPTVETTEVTFEIGSLT